MVSAFKTPIFHAHRDGQDAYWQFRFWENMAIIFASILVVLTIGLVISETAKHSGAFMATMFGIQGSTEVIIAVVAIAFGLLIIPFAMAAIGAVLRIEGKIAQLEMALTGKADGSLMKSSMVNIEKMAKVVLFNQVYKRQYAKTAEEWGEEHRKFLILYGLVREFQLLQSTDLQQALREIEFKAS